MNIDKWEKHYHKLGIDTSAICRDGVFDKEEWKNVNKKILFIMKEVNKWKGGDLKTLFKDGPKYQMWHTISRWAGGILNNFPKYEEIDEWSARKANIKKIASINLKKTSGEAFSNMSIINAYAHTDKELLLEQIDEIQPEIIVACGTFDSVIWLLDLKVNPDRIYLDKINPDKLSRYPVFEKSRNIWVIPWVHPCRVDNRKTYDKLKDLFAKIP